ncbi:unnamed protein product [Paramecium octaurelia]|uniref:Uncharacterized protein n=1 Tax=Paramecium octaurelia TaxID=43137 RepID=A0A8S1VJ44_PAROT|nr:unnamed protein product [Paramecium octaurelia]
MVYHLATGSDTFEFQIFRLSLSVSKIHQNKYIKKGGLIKLMQYAISQDLLLGVIEMNTY